MTFEWQFRYTGGRGVSEYWSIGVLEYWSIGVLEYWSIGVLEYWSIGVLEWWSDGWWGEAPERPEYYRKANSGSGALCLVTPIHAPSRSLGHTLPEREESR